jgi:hypothetical protein
VLGLAIVLAGCSKAASPPDASAAAAPLDELHQRLPLDAAWFGQLDRADLKVLERHLESSPRWEVREETRVWAKKVVRYAVRLEPVKDPPSEGATAHLELIPGAYRTSLNGFYSDFQAPQVLQRRVIVGLGNEFGLGKTAKASHVAAGKTEAPLLSWRGGDQPGLQSHLVVDGAQGWTIEIFEQSRAARREFTPRALSEVLEELRSALGAREEIVANGFSAALLRDTPLRMGEPILDVVQGMQPGIYRVTGWANPGEAGVALLRIVQLGPDSKAGPAMLPAELRGKEGTFLSPEHVEARSRRWMGWSTKGEVLFPYQSEVAVYEGDWKHLQSVRFELWFRPANGGADRKLVESLATISGWER